MAEQLYSLEAEAATLGSMMLEPGCIDWLTGYLAKEDFFLPHWKGKGIGTLLCKCGARKFLGEIKR